MIQMDLLGLICPGLGVAPLVEPRTDLEDEQPTPVGSPLAAVDECMPRRRAWTWT